MNLFKSFRYSRLPNDSKTESQYPNGARDSKARSPSSLVLLVLLSFAVGALGFFSAQFAKHLFSSRPSLGYLPVDTIVQEFRYNRSFSDAPSNHTNEAWRAIFPIGGGFFTSPVVAPTRSTFSVYHQLHCLDGIRYGYHMNHEAAVQGRYLPDEHVPWDLQPRHMRHCIDLLRQALMCNADTTVETVDEEVNGVHGFRTEHQCKNWETLVSWTDEQQRRERAGQS